jgi:hypothetical protein
MRKEHFLFNLLCFLYFRRSRAHVVETSVFGILIAAPYVFFSEFYFFLSHRYFVIYGKRIVGLVAFEQGTEALFISVLATHPSYIEMGIAHHVLEH